MNNIGWKKDKINENSCHISAYQGEISKKVQSTTGHSFRKKLSDQLSSKIDSIQKVWKNSKTTKNHKIDPKVWYYNKKIKYFIENNNIGMAYVWKKEMELCHIEPDSYTYAVLINKHCDKDQMDQAMKLISEMREKKIALDILAYNILIKFYLKKNEIEQALEIISEIQNNHSDIEPDNYTYTVLIHKYCNEGQMDQAMKLLTKMKEKKTVLEAFTYNILIKSLCKKNEVEQALELIKEMESNHIKQDEYTYGPVIEEFIRTQQFTRAIDFYYAKTNRNAGLTHVLLNGLILSDTGFELYEKEAIKIYQKSKIKLEQVLINGKKHIDFHGFTKGSALIAILDYLNYNDSLIAIPGKGLHSSHPMFDLRDFLKNRLSQIRPNLKVEIDPNNEGTLLICRNNKSL